jgi:hypothetical protein
LRGLSNKNISSLFLIFCRTPHDNRFRSKRVVFENNDKNVVLKGIICIYVSNILNFDWLCTDIFTSEKKFVPNKHLTLSVTCFWIWHLKGIPIMLRYLYFIPFCALCVRWLRLLELYAGTALEVLDVTRIFFLFLLFRYAGNLIDYFCFISSWNFMVHIWIFRIKGIMYWVKKDNLFVIYRRTKKDFGRYLYSNLGTHSFTLVLLFCRCGVHSETDHDLGVWQVVSTSDSGSDFVTRGYSHKNSSEPRYLAVT